MKVKCFFDLFKTIKNDGMSSRGVRGVNTLNKMAFVGMIFDQYKNSCFAFFFDANAYI